MTDFPATLRRWRQTRRYSQLALSLDADVSARHISFLETGRARPSREMVARLGEAMNLPLTARNELLSHAGFAPRYEARDWDDAAMAPVRSAVEYMLGAHDPYPGLALDRIWNIVSMNASATRLFGAFGVTKGQSLLTPMLSGAIAQVVENWPSVASAAASRLRIESAAAGGIAELDDAASRLSNQGTDAPSNGPVIPTIVQLGGMRLSMFATIAQFGTPEDLALDDLKVELYFPSDDDTKAFFAATQ